MGNFDHGGGCRSVGPEDMREISEFSVNLKRH